jgi:hypothetical protein
MEPGMALPRVLALTFGVPQAPWPARPKFWLSGIGGRQGSRLSSAKVPSPLIQTGIPTPPSRSRTLNMPARRSHRSGVAALLLSVSVAANDCAPATLTDDNYETLQTCTHFTGNLTVRAARLVPVPGAWRPSPALYACGKGS